MSVYFLSVVGSSDPDGNPRGPIALRENNGPLLSTLFDHRGGLVATRELHFDYVLLFCSDRANETTFFDLAQQVKGRIDDASRRAMSGPQVEIIRLEDCDPTDIDECISKLLAELRARVADATEVHIALTPGAVGFQAAWYEISSWGLLPNARCWKCLNPDFVGARRVQPLDTNRHRRTVLIQQGLQSLEAFTLELAAVSFRNASHEFGDLGPEARIVEALALACEGLDLWDQSIPGDAQDRLQEAASRIADIPGATDLKNRLAEFSEALPSRKDNAQGLMRSAYGVYGSLSRLLARGQYDRVASRGRNCVERVVRSFRSAHNEVIDQLCKGTKNLKGDSKTLLRREGIGSQLEAALKVYQDAARRPGFKFPSRTWRFPRLDTPGSQVVNFDLLQRIAQLWEEAVWREESPEGLVPIGFNEVVNQSAELHFGRPPLTREQAEQVTERVKMILHAVSGIESDFPDSKETLFGANSYLELAALARKALGLNPARAM